MKSHHAKVRPFHRSSQGSEPDGQLRPGHVVWVHKGGRLFKTASEQLRKSSPYEHMVEELHAPVDLPWTITALASNQNKVVFQDISQERPPDAQWEEAPTEEKGDRGVMLRRRSKLEVRNERWRQYENHSTWQRGTKV